MSRRLLPLSGCVSVVLFVLVLSWLAGNTPGTKDSAAKVTSFYLAHHTRQNVGSVALCIGAVFLVLFAATAWKEVEGGRPWRLVFVSGAAVAAAGFLAAAGIHLALSEGVHARIAPSAVQALNVLDANDYLFFAFGMAIMLLGAAGMLIPRHGVDRVFGWAALVLAVAIATPIGFVGFLGSGIWVVVASIVLSVRAGEETRPAAVGANAVTA